MAHAISHINVQPAQYGRPLLNYDLCDFILDLLHLAELGIPKTPWKHGILKNASDDARVKISDKLAELKHPLDCRRKDDNRSRAQKWFTGEAWASFCAGTRGCPGGPRAIAEVVKIIADELQQRGVSSGASTAETATDPAVVVAAPAAAKPRGKAAAAGRNANALANAKPSPVTGGEPLQAKQAQLKHVPTAMERAADPADIKAIRDLYGSRAQTLINALLSFDAYFSWYYPLKAASTQLDVFDSDTNRVQEVALENCRAAIDMHEICERLSIRNHKSFLFHGAIFKVTRDILRVANSWMFGISSLELQNADTKRCAKQSGSRRLQTSTSGLTRVGLAPGYEGPSKLVTTRGYGSTMSLSTLNFMLVRGYLRVGDGLVATPMSRRKERLFGVGRTSLPSAGVKLELLGADYDPKSDTCVKAFVRCIAASAAAAMALDDAVGSP